MDLRLLSVCVCVCVLLPGLSRGVGKDNPQLTMFPYPQYGASFTAKAGSYEIWYKPRNFGGSNLIGIILNVFSDHKYIACLLLILVHCMYRAS